MDQKPENLEIENNRLREENEQLKTQLQNCLDLERLRWNLFIPINTKLQLQSTSIKAAVSSLLDRNIFWEVSAQQEFLETIRQSIDQVSDRMLQITLANHLRAGTLEINRKFYELHELMREVQERVLQINEHSFHYEDFVAKGSLVFVDYRCFIHALSILFSMFDERISPSLTFESESNQYVLSLTGTPDPINAVLRSIMREEWAAESLYRELPAEKTYELLLVVHLLEYQGIRLILEGSHPAGIRIEVPAGETD